MAREPGIRMKIFQKTGQFTDIVDDGRMADQDNEDLQHLILIPKNHMQGKCAKCLRLVFYSLVAVSVLSIGLILSREHFSSRITEDSELHTAWKKTQMPAFASGKNKSPDLCQISDLKFDCHPEPRAIENVCVKRGCCWNPVGPQNGIPWCYFPYGFSYYAFNNLTSTKLGLQGSAVSVRPSVRPKDVKNLNIQVIYETEDIVRIKITDAQSPRFEVPLDYVTTEKKSQNQNYVVKQRRDGIQVFRKNTQFPLFDSTVAPLIYSDQFLQITTSLVSSYLYGIGETVESLHKGGGDWKRYVLFNRDQIPGINRNLYGSHPFYMVVDNKGNSYGVFLANSNAMEVEVQPGNFLTFRTIGGILDLRIFLGPKPSDVMNQYTAIIGRPAIPPYWSLGFHLCRFNYGTLNHTAEILENNLRAGIPIDVQWNDLDYMRNQDDFTVDPKKFAGLKDFVEDLHLRGMRYVPLIDPGISAGEEVGKYRPYDEGLKMDIFIKNDEGHPFVGKVWNPKATVWPDFSHPNITSYWLNQLQDFRGKVSFDGAWIDMNEPSNFDDGEHNKGCAKNSLNNPPYLPQVTGGSLYSKTICPSALQAGGRHYDLHNLYGTQETIVTYKVLGDLTNERPFIISRSTFPGQGRFGGHWTGDVVSSWEDLKQTIPQILSFGLYGIPLVGADICGFNGNTTVDLCKRWMQLGAFYPFARNHNTDDGIPQDPVSLGPEVTSASKEVLTVRYSLLPYIYTMFFQAHLTGQPVARALFYEFPEDASTFFIDNYFMLGSSVMVVPILEENYSKPTIEAYLPKGWWYQHYFAEIIESLGEERELQIPENSIPILYRGGSIIMKQDPALNTQLSRHNKFHIHVFLSKDSNATGDFYWDDGVSNLPHTLVQYDHFVFKAEKNVFTMTKEFSGYDTANMTLGSIEIRGVRFPVSSAVLNNVPYKFDYSKSEKTLKLDGLSLIGASWTDGLALKWS
ncbi:unnamed protein product [Orchesella dallaii]|uniref:P-type domain-containing protein n=1 Tax=Orchesella dallaii TaxID=48710 RepID=A0ABP1PRL6_9HEXA